MSRQLFRAGQYVRVKPGSPGFTREWAGTVLQGGKKRHTYVVLPDPVYTDEDSDNAPRTVDAKYLEPKQRFEA